MQLEELGIAEQAEAVHDLPLDLELAGAKCLCLGWPDDDGSKNRDEKKQFRHGAGL
jgi:hypothetical protein